MAESEELVLGTEEIVPELSPAPQPVEQGAAPRVFGEESAAPATGTGDARRRWLAGGPDEAVPPAPKVKLGGTLFERMSNAARGAAKEEEPAKEPVELPRFLHRQGNQ